MTLLTRISRSNVSPFGIVKRSFGVTPTGPPLWDGTQYPKVSSSDTGPYRWPQLIVASWDKEGFDPIADLDNFEEIPRDGFGVPAHIPPEIAVQIRHTFAVPPQYYPWLKKLGDDTPQLKPFMDRLIKGELTQDEYEDMFYMFSKPLKIYRSEIPHAHRSQAEIESEDYVKWESAWLAYRQRLRGDLHTRYYLRNLLIGAVLGFYIASVYVEKHVQHRVDMKLFYLEAPEHKINWVKPRGDL